MIIKNKTIRLLLIINFIILILPKINYSGEDSVSIEKGDKTMKPKWKNVLGKRIFFGHQSVGSNIINGISKIAPEYPITEIDLTNPSVLRQNTESGFMHANLGKNKDPLSKINMFEQAVSGILHNQVDIAFFKFCYVDISDQTDINRVFAIYRDTITRLKINNPNVLFIHVTVPLTVIPNIAIAQLKNLLGRPDSRIADNIKRNQFNDMIRKEYGKETVIFDLAAIESTYSDGIRRTFTKDNAVYYSLVPEYTNDGGHLNKIAQQAIAVQLLNLLADKRYSFEP